jgi:hypothetical protein
VILPLANRILRPIPVYGQNAAFRVRDSSMTNSPKRILSGAQFMTALVAVGMLAACENEGMQPKSAQVPTVNILQAEGWSQPQPQTTITAGEPAVSQSIVGESQTAVTAQYPAPPKPIVIQPQVAPVPAYGPAPQNVQHNYFYPPTGGVGVH